MSIAEESARKENDRLMHGATNVLREIRMLKDWLDRAVNDPVDSINLGKVLEHWRRLTE